MTQVKKLDPLPEEEAWTSEHDRPKSLSRRQRQVIALLSHGLSLVEMADLMRVSPKTVEIFRTLAFRKLGLRNRAEATRWAIHQGVDMSSPVSNGLSADLTGDCAPEEVLHVGDLVEVRKLNNGAIRVIETEADGSVRVITLIQPGRCTWVAIQNGQDRDGTCLKISRRSAVTISSLITLNPPIILTSSQAQSESGAGCSPCDCVHVPGIAREEN
ncbi:MAG: helix-turn-helix transcriptional regulator [Planctomycetes bacterium]|nr:helix-turn-helix transcriptional regulator [Planctomycetota bacterium]